MRLTMVMVCADPCLAHAHAHVRDAGRYDTTVGAAGDEWYYIFGSSSNVTVRVSAGAAAHREAGRPANETDTAETTRTAEV